VDKGKSKYRVSARLAVITPLELYLKITECAGKLALLKQFRYEIDGRYFATPEKKRKLLTFRPERLDADRKFIGFVCLMTISLCQSIRAHLVMWQFVEPYLGNTLGSGRFQRPGS
jgi:hypothetical protein